MATFGLSLKEVDAMPWPELVRWHCQHQRIQEEQIQLAQITGQMASLTTLGGIAPPEVPNG